MISAPFRIGLQVPNFNFPGVEPAGLLDALTEIGRAAENAGFDALFVMDHLHQVGGSLGPESDFMLEGTATLGALAGRTNRLQLGLMVGGVTYRNPALHAKLTTTIDVLSNGRAIFGVGAAWFESEHLAYGLDFPPLPERFERLEEAVQITRAMFTQDRPTFAGKHYRIDKPYNNPRPIRGDIPILIGGSGERKTLRMVAQYADAANILGDATHIRHLLGVLERHCETLGRDPAEITKTRLATVVIADTDEKAQAEVAPLRERIAPERFASVVIAGDPDEVGEQIAAGIEAGLDGIICNLPRVDDPERVAQAGEVLAAAIRR